MFVVVAKELSQSTAAASSCIQACKAKTATVFGGGVDFQNSRLGNTFKKSCHLCSKDVDGAATKLAKAGLFLRSV